MSLHNSTKSRLFPVVRELGEIKGKGTHVLARGQHLEQRQKILQDSPMTPPTLRRLHLGAALRYLPSDRIRIPGDEAASGGDCIWTFDSEDIVFDDPSSGPMLRRPLHAAFFSGEAAARSNSGHGQDEYSIAPGDYFFIQWRKASYATMEDGLEDFIRQVWWKGEKTEGPWILRTIAEDGNTAYQGLRSISRA